VFGSETTEEKMKVGDKELENVTEFLYLGSLISWDNDCGEDSQGSGCHGRVQEVKKSV